MAGWMNGWCALHRGSGSRMTVSRSAQQQYSYLLAAKRKRCAVAAAVGSWISIRAWLLKIGVVWNSGHEVWQEEMICFCEGSRVKTDLCGERSKGGRKQCQRIWVAGRGARETLRGRWFGKDVWRVVRFGRHAAMLFLFPQSVTPESHVMV